MLKVSTRQMRLKALIKSTSGLISVEDAAKALELERTHAAKLLAGWHKQGVLRRVSHGLYVSIQPSAIDQTQVLEDPWVLVPELYTPGYIGGWSALEYWELTEQLFRSVCVLSSKRTSYGDVTLQGVHFFIRHVPKKQVFGTKVVWRDRVKVQISDPHKTMLDIIDDLDIGGGLQHTIDCLKEFLRRYNNASDLDRLLEYALIMDKGSLYKKLGYVAETLDVKNSFVEECKNRMTKGNAYLDKRAKNNQLVRRWNLWVPKDNISDR